MTDRIKQICPAPGWLAIYVFDEAEPEARAIEHLACWALMDSGAVVGLVASESGLEVADDDPSFVEYLAPGEEPRRRQGGVGGLKVWGHPSETKRPN